MQLTTFPSVVLAAALGASESEPALLNSERIEQRFGNYGIKALASEPGLRRSSLYSVHDDKPTCRTYALVRFAEQHDDRYREEHAKVLAGKSIGAIFRSHGWDVRKQTIYIGGVEVPAAPATITELMRIEGNLTLALHVYQLLLVRNDQVFEYATIVEIHHPEYLSERDLVDLYEYDINLRLPRQGISDLTGLLFSAGQ